MQTKAGLVWLCVVLSGSLGLAVPAMGQTPATGAATSAPITTQEMDVAVGRAFGLFRQSLQLPASTFQPSTARSVASRDQVIQRLAQLFRYVRPKIRKDVKPKAEGLARIGKGLSAPRQAELRALMSYGLVGERSPLVTGRLNQFSPREFGDILADFVEGAMEITHEVTDF